MNTCKKCKKERECNHYQYCIGRNINSDYQSYNHGTSFGWTQSSAYSLIDSSGVDICTYCKWRNVAYTYFLATIFVGIPVAFLYFAFEYDFWWKWNLLIRAIVGLGLGFYLLTVGFGYIAFLFIIPFKFKKFNEEFAIELSRKEIENQYSDESIKFPNDSVQAEDLGVLRVFSHSEYSSLKSQLPNQKNRN